MFGLRFLLLVSLLAGCASGKDDSYADAPTFPDFKTAPGLEPYSWPDMGSPPDGFVPPDAPGDLLPHKDQEILLDTAVPDMMQPDVGSPCADPYEPNENCTAAKSLGSTKEGNSWVTKTATSSPSNDADWFTAKGEEGSNTCVPFTNECFYFSVKLDVPAGRKLKVCVLQDSCGASPTCADNGTNPGPVELNVKYKVDGTCAFSDDTDAKIWVEQLDAVGACPPYKLKFNYDDC